MCRVSTQRACAATFARARPLSRRAKRERLPRLERLSPESQGQNLAMTVLCVPESGRDLLI